nr:hypothetical protein BaRGS_020356 [Batillaria attramentaria]
MAKIAERYSPEFIMELGDNFYYDGVKNVEDKRFKVGYYEMCVKPVVTFEDIYSQKSLQIPWYLVAGNHDHNGNVSAQIAYSKVSKRWNFPNYYYPLKFTIPGTSDSVEFVMMDTVLLCGNTGDDRLHTQPAGPADKQVANDQWTFVQNSLQNSKATYLFTAGHFPVYSIAEHGPTKCLVDQLLPMLYKYKASGHMSGHDHNLQHLRSSKDGVTLDFILSGCANFIDGSLAHQNSVPAGTSKFHWADLLGLGGLVYAEATATNMTVTYIEAKGSVLYQTTVYPRKI